MAENDETLATDTSDREMVMTRVLEAPRELVFKVWTERDHIGRWWGPRGFTTTTHEMEVKVGGIWRFIMHGPDGTDYPNRIDYLEVVRPERLVYDHGGDDVEDVHFRVTVTFTDDGGKTRLTMRLLFDSAEDYLKCVDSSAIEGGNQTLDRLAEHLAAIR